MKTFLTGLFILIVGASLYGKLCEKVFGPDDRKTPAYTKQDGETDEPEYVEESENTDNISVKKEEFQVETFKITM